MLKVIDVYGTTILNVAQELQIKSSRGLAQHFKDIGQDTPPKYIFKVLSSY